MRAATLTVTHTIVFCLSKQRIQWSVKTLHSRRCANSRLGIPQFKYNDGPQGFRGHPGWSTSWPAVRFVVFLVHLYPHLFSKVRANLTIRNLHFTNLGASLYCKAVACCDGGDACERSLAKKNSTRLNLQHRTANVNMHIQPHA